MLHFSDTAILAVDKKSTLNDPFSFHTKLLASLEKLQDPIKYVHFREAYLSKFADHMQSSTWGQYPRLSSLGACCVLSGMGSQAGVGSGLQGSVVLVHGCWVSGHSRHLQWALSPRPNKCLGRTFCLSACLSVCHLVQSSDKKCGSLTICSSCCHDE